jgi:KDO2-lipid IV(A) lauroyltransferase
MVDVLRGGACLGLLIDQHINAPGVYVPFFGRPALTPTVAAKLSLITGAPILPMGIYLNRHGRHVVHVLPPVTAPEGGTRDDVVHELTARCSAAIEDLVRIDPKQWVWFHHRWREPEEAGRAYAVQN